MQLSLSLWVDRKQFRKWLMYHLLSKSTYHIFFSPKKAKLRWSSPQNWCLLLTSIVCRVRYIIKGFSELWSPIVVCFRMSSVEMNGSISVLVMLEREIHTRCNWLDEILLSRNLISSCTDCWPACST